MKTAVEWLEEICNDRGYHLMSEYFEQAKEMEKQQIIDAVKSTDYIIGATNKESEEFAQKYYNETMAQTYSNVIKQIDEFKENINIEIL